jgi:hypothetical protein
LLFNVVGCDVKFLQQWETASRLLQQGIGVGVSSAWVLLLESLDYWLLATVFLRNGVMWLEDSPLFPLCDPPDCSTCPAFPHEACEYPDCVLYIFFALLVFGSTTFAHL